MIILATYQGIFINILPFGISYAASQWTLKKHNEKSKYLSDYYSFSFYVTIPLIIISSFIIWQFLNYNIISGDLLLFTIANIFALILQIFAKVEIARYRNDKSILINSMYSIFNSIFVPLVYFIKFQNLSGVLIAWIISSGVVILMNLKNQYGIIKLSLNFASWKNMLVFSFPIYIMSIINITNLYADKLFIYAFYEPLELNGYYWIDKLLLIGSQVTNLFLAGVYSMLVLLKNENVSRFHNISRSIFRNIGLISIAVFLSFNANAVFIVNILLPEQYFFAIDWLRTLSYIFIIQNLINYLMIRYLADEKRKSVAVIRLMGIIIRFSFAFYFIDKRIEGLIIGIYVSAIITLIALIFFTEELRHWKLETLIRYLGFSIISIIIMIITNYNFVWPITNVSLFAIFIMLIVIKPLNRADTNYITKVVPVRLKKYVTPFMNLISHY